MSLEICPFSSKYSNFLAYNCSQNLLRIFSPLSLNYQWWFLFEFFYLISLNYQWWFLLFNVLFCLFGSSLLLMNLTKGFSILFIFFFFFLMALGFICIYFGIYLSLAFISLVCWLFVSYSLFPLVGTLGYFEIFLVSWSRSVLL